MLVLVGMRCAGKSTVGGAVAARAGRRFLDADEELARSWCAELGGQEQAGAGELLERFGLEQFRTREAALLSDLLAGASDLVPATGGGCVESEAVRALLDPGVHRVVWLDAPSEVLAARLAADPGLRPSLTGAAPAEELALIHARRAALYAQVSELRLDASRPPEELVRALSDQPGR